MRHDMARVNSIAVYPTDVALDNDVNSEAKSCKDVVEVYIVIGYRRIIRFPDD